MARASGWVMFALVVFIGVCELVFRLLPVSTATETDYHHAPHIRTYPAGHRWTTSTGWDLRRAQPMVANNAGFAAEHTFVPNPNAVALIGDSYVEASMLPMEQRLAHQIERVLGERRPVYAMGSPGTSLLDYGERVRFARERYGVRDVVLLVEAGDVTQSVCGSGNVEGPCLDEATLALRFEHHPPPSALKRWARRSAFAQYLFSQLKIEPTRLWRQARQQSMPGQGHAVGASSVAQSMPPDTAPDLRLVDAVVAAFFDRVHSGTEGRVVLIVDGNRSGPKASRRWQRAERSRFIELARAGGAVVVDAEPVFKAHYAISALSLDVSPTDSHLNALGLSLLAPPVAAALKTSY